MSLPTPSLPPQVPTRSLAPAVDRASPACSSSWGCVVWKLMPSNEPAPEAQTAAPAAATRPAPAPAVATSPRAASATSPGGARSAGGRQHTRRGTRARPTRADAKATPVKRDPNCDDPCNGRETPELLSALGAKAGQARSCYEKALSNNSALAGRLEIGVRVSRTGAVCSASVGKDGLGQCLRRELRARRDFEAGRTRSPPAAAWMSPCP